MQEKIEVLRGQIKNHTRVDPPKSAAIDAVIQAYEESERVRSILEKEVIKLK